MKEKIVIIGGVAGGATAATRIRRLNEEAEIIILERGKYVSFANCGLPYYIGETIQERDDLFVAKPKLFKTRYNIDVRIKSEVTSINREDKFVVVSNLQNGHVYNETYDKLLIATGSSPFVPFSNNDLYDNVFSLWTVEDADKIKNFVTKNNSKKALIAGGGFIGLEMAENLSNIGIDVTLVEFNNQVMPTLDYEMASLVSKELINNGVKLELGLGVSAFKNNGQTVVLSDGREVCTDLTILAIGVRPNSKLAKDCGLKLNDRGGIIVDEYMRTSDEFIYAVGDVVEITNPINDSKAMIALAGPANKEARCVAANILGLSRKEKYPGTLGASIAKIFNLEVGGVGETEKSLIRQGCKYGKDYDYSIVHGKNHVKYYPGSNMISIKLIFSLQDARVLGAQIIGIKDVSKRIDVISTLIRFKGTIYDLSTLELSYAPPFNGPKDPVNIAGYVACDIYEGLSNQVLWQDIKDSNKYTLLDVRYPGEIIFQGTYGGAIEIPIDQLRERLNELDKSCKYAIYCTVGLRGYVAERILKSNGFECFNIKGGLITVKCWE